MLPCRHFIGRNMPEPKNLEQDLLQAMHQHSHHNAGGLLPGEGYAGQGGGPAACSGMMPCSIPAIPPGSWYLLQADHIAIASV